MNHHPRDHLWSQGPLAGLLLLVAACSQPASAADKDNLHGAAPVAEQQKRLSALLTHDTSKPPRGIDPLIWAALVPDDNKLTPARIELGRKLYFDARLSSDGTVSCATCHDVTRCVHRPPAGLRRHRRAARPAQLADHDERRALPDPVLGRPCEDARGPGQAADPQSDRDGHAGREGRRGGHRRRSRVQAHVRGRVRTRRSTTRTSAAPSPASSAR